MTEPDFCPTLKPTSKQFDRDFTNFVRAAFQKFPDAPCLKVIPPKGWAPRKSRPDLSKLRIQTPIKQHVFGKGGAYVCILEEHRSMTAADFKKLSERPEHQPPKRARGAQDDELQERAFWSSVTNSPPLYGADTPVSLFDSKVAWGWNLRRLGCMLQDPQYDVPDIPGVTSPMCYFGMWKSFFGWHKEDIDLYSINYLHFGAPKVWYCVSPKDNPRFEAMAQALYPDLYHNCHGFMRHKDILISPRLLRQYNVPYVRAHQQPGEFIVLNAAAFHAGYNLGFNCAEAVNFAMPEWIEAGKAAVPCTCSCLPDGVALDMGIFCPELREEQSSEEEEEDSDEEEGSEAEEEEEEAEESSEEEEQQQQQQPARPRSRAAPTPPRKRAAPAQRGRGRKAAATPSDSEGEEAAGSSSGEESEGEAAPARKRQRGAGGAVKPLRVGRLPDLAKPVAKASDVPRGAAHTQWGKVAEQAPLAVVERDERTKQLRFSLVHRLAKPSSKAGAMWVGLLKDGGDGLYRPQGSSRLLQLGAQYPRVVRVRAEWAAPDPKSKQRAGGWALKTKPERILM